jgi:hypothetical protein
MQNTGNRPQHVKPEELNDAVNEALQRVEEGNNLSQDELDKVNGAGFPIDIIDHMGDMSEM